MSDAVVSIPFIAGQWSLHSPLVIVLRYREVSIPFIAGQWSLRARRMAGGGGGGASQSPSLRGSGRFAEARCDVAKHVDEVSIPFIAGQWSLLLEADPDLQAVRLVSIPFIAGQWSLHAAYLDEPPGWRLVSIPFIAGQWSLLDTRPAWTRVEVAFQSPSLRGSGRFVEVEFVPAGQARFNPLHCGAVVASARRKAGGQGGTHVSIPFIAGQWSLPAAAPGETIQGRRFQSPSLRGSGRFGWPLASAPTRSI